MWQAWRRKEIHTEFGGETWKNGTFGRSRRRSILLKYILKNRTGEYGLNSSCKQQTQVTLVNTVLAFSTERGEIPDWGNIGFWRKALFHRVMPTYFKTTACGYKFSATSKRSLYRRISKRTYKNAIVRVLLLQSKNFPGITNVNFHSASKYKQYWWQTQFIVTYTIKNVHT
jgi:hypothetical protein